MWFCQSHISILRKHKTVSRPIFPTAAELCPHAIKGHCMSSNHISGNSAVPAPKPKRDSDFSHATPQRTQRGNFFGFCPTHFFLSVFSKDPINVMESSTVFRVKRGPVKTKWGHTQLFSKRSFCRISTI